jgi:hypothetical protein
MDMFQTHVLSLAARRTPPHAAAFPPGDTRLARRRGPNDGGEFALVGARTTQILDPACTGVPTMEAIPACAGLARVGPLDEFVDAMMRIVQSADMETKNSDDEDSDLDEFQISLVKFKQHC